MAKSKNKETFSLFKSRSDQMEFNGFRTLWVFNTDNPV